MKILWCWRCGMEVPMLDEEEYAIVHKLYGEGIKSKDAGSIKERMQPVVDYYNSLTGFEATEANAVMHHRISLYGPPCEQCGKPYRTPQASFCAACGYKRS